MGADRSRTRLILGLCLAGLLLAATFIALASAQAAPATAPSTSLQCRKQFQHNRKARIACEKRIKKKLAAPTSGCTLETFWDGAGDGGDKKDFGVTLNVAGNEPGPYTAAVEVTIHSPKVEICSATVKWYEGQGASGQRSAPVTIGRHGGVSSRISLPVNADGMFVKVMARLR
jgi:hypothetical protein